MAISIVTDAIGWVADGSGEKLTVSTNLARNIAAKLEPGKKYAVEIKQYRPKRSLDSNALYWALVGKLADALHTSTAEIHNLMLRRYGQLERYGDELVRVVIPETEDTQKKTDQAETYHLKPTSHTRVGKDGRTYRTYLMLRGSSTYDTKEMTRLIDGLISECNDAGIDTTSYKDRGLLE